MDHLFRGDLWNFKCFRVSRRGALVGVLSFLAAIAIEHTTGALSRYGGELANFLGPGGLAGLLCFGIVGWIFYLNLR